MNDNMNLDRNDDLEFDFDDNFSDELSSLEWEKVSECYEKLEEELREEDKYFSPTNQEDENNLFRKLEECEYGRLLAATILRYGKFDEDFILISLPVWDFIYGEDKVEKNPPEQFELKGDIIDVPGGTGTQFATYNSRTREFAYTRYSIRDVNMFNGVRGKGKVPLTKQRMLDWGEYIPV